MAALLILFPERAARPTRGGGHGGAGTRSQGPSTHLAKLTLRWKSYLQAVNFQHLKKQEKFLATPMGKGILLLSLSLIKYRFVVTHLLYIYISTKHQLRWNQSMCLLIWGCIFQLVLRDESKLQKSVTIFFCHRVELFVDNNLCLSVVW